MKGQCKLAPCSVSLHNSLREGNTDRWSTQTTKASGDGATRTWQHLANPLATCAVNHIAAHPAVTRCTFFRVTRGMGLEAQEPQWEKDRSKGKTKRGQTGGRVEPLPSQLTCCPFSLFVFIHHCLPLRHQAVSVYRRD